MNGTRHREVGEYLRRLQRSMADLPAERRDEILAEIDEHIAELLSEHPAATDADVRNVLERVGDPEDIAAEARERLDVGPATWTTRQRASWTDIAAVTLLVLGFAMITPFYRPEGLAVAWGAAIVLMWISEVWSTHEKIRVTLVLPAGVLCAVAIQGAGDEGFLYFAIILFASIWPPVHLGLKLRQANRAREQGAVEAQVQPAGTRDRDRATRWLIGGVLAVVVVGATLFALWSSPSGRDDPLLIDDDAPRITQAQFDQVTLGDSKEDVSRILGEPGGEGSIVSGLDPTALEEPAGVGEQEFVDCWSYPVTGSGAGAGSDASVCFNSSAEVVYTRVRIASSG